jgi:hypothetical protein
MFHVKQKYRRITTPKFVGSLRFAANRSRPSGAKAQFLPEVMAWLKPRPFKAKTN